MLMDEPFGAVDPIVRERLQDELLRLQETLAKTILFVTHDIDEAIKMGDLVAVLQEGGVLAQFGPPAEILAGPASPFVARFVGTDRGLKRLSLRRVDDLELLPPVTARASEDAGPRSSCAALASPFPWLLLVDDLDRPACWIARDDVRPGVPLAEAPSVAGRAAARPAGHAQGRALDPARRRRPRRDRRRPRAPRPGPRHGGRDRRAAARDGRPGPRPPTERSASTGWSRRARAHDDPLGLDRRQPRRDRRGDPRAPRAHPHRGRRRVRPQPRPRASAIYRWRRLYGPVAGVAGLLYTIPSLALFAVLVPFTGLSVLTAEIGLVGYTLLILIRGIVSGIDGVPRDAVEAATGMGYTRRQRLSRVELPLAVPVIVTSVRLATVTTIGLVMVTALIGEGGLGQLMLRGFNRGFPTMVYVGVVMSVVLAVTLDLALVAFQRLLTPWARTRTA